MKLFSLPRVRRFAPLSLLALLPAALLLTAFPTTAKTAGRLLSDAEMAAIFGDAPDGAANNLPCWQASNCNMKYTLGTNQCSYCKVDVPRQVCCNLGTKDDCNPSGGNQI